MTLCWFAQANAPGAVVTGTEPDWLVETVAAVPGVTQALLHTPTTTHDPYLNDGPPPALALQVYFAGIEALETALDGPLMTLADRDWLPFTGPVSHFTMPTRPVRT